MQKQLVDPRQPTEFELTVELSKRLDEALEDLAMRSIRRVRDYGWVGAKEEDIGPEGNTPECYRKQLKDFQEVYGQLYPKDDESDEESESDDSIYAYGCDFADSEDESSCHCGCSCQSGSGSRAGPRAGSDNADGDGDRDTIMVESEGEGENEGRANASDGDDDPIRQAASTTEADGKDETDDQSDSTSSTSSSSSDVPEPITMLTVGYPPSHPSNDPRRVNDSVWLNSGRRRPYGIGLASIVEPVRKVKSKKRRAPGAKDEGNENKRPRYYIYFL